MAMETVRVAETCDAGLRLQAVRRASGRLGWQIQDAAAVEATAIALGRGRVEGPGEAFLGLFHRNWRDFVVSGRFDHDRCGDDGEGLPMAAAH